MAKTNPIGVRFRQDILNKLKVDHAITSPQKALIFLELFYVSHHYLAKDVTQILRKDIPKEIQEKGNELGKPIIDNSDNQKSYAEYNFVNEQWLILEKYTKFPNSQKPKTWRSQMEWTKQKRESDQKIIIAWAEFKKDINGQHNI